MTSLSALATLPALPVHVAGRRAEKSPRLTAVTTFSITRGSISLVAITFPGMCFDSSPRVRPLPFPSSRFRRSLVAWDPELHPCSRTGLALDAALAAGKLGSLAYCDEAEVTRRVLRFGDADTFAVVPNDNPDAAIGGISRDLDARGKGMLLDVGQRLRDVLEDRRLDGCRKGAREADVEVGLDAGARSKRLEARTDGLVQAQRHLAGLRAHIQKEPAQGILDLLQGG